MLKKIKKFFIRLIADIYINKKPFFILYKPNFHKLKGHEIRYILKNIKKGDILLRSFHGYLNTVLTPGFWSHAALYIGNDTVIHAVGAGVIKEDILDFCRCDDIAILRIKNVSIENVKTAIVTAQDIVEKNIQYDFEFESGDDELYCTELVDMCYDNIFKNYYKSIFGNIVLTPDAIHDSPIIHKIITFKH